MEYYNIFLQIKFNTLATQVMCGTSFLPSSSNRTLELSRHAWFLVYIRNRIIFLSLSQENIGRFLRDPQSPLDLLFLISFNFDHSLERKKRGSIIINHHGVTKAAEAASCQILKCAKEKLWVDPNETNNISMANSSMSSLTTFHFCCTALLSYTCCLLYFSFLKILLKQGRSKGNREGQPPPTFFKSPYKCLM